MSLCVLAYPVVSADDYARIQEFRRENDELYFHVVEPHFALVFSWPEWEPETFVPEVRKQARGFGPFDFCIRSAALDRDSFVDCYHAFLVPDEGHSQILKLHDRLYADKLFPQRLLTVDFIPHMGVGNSADPLKCLEMVESWNKAEFAIPGRIAVLDIADYDGRKVETIERVRLAG